MTLGIKVLLIAGVHGLALADKVCPNELDPGQETKSNTLIQLNRKGMQVHSKVIAGVPVYNYERLHPSIELSMLESGAEPGEELFDWIFSFKDEADIDLICAEADADCTFKAPKLGMDGIRATTDGMARLTEKFADELEFVEPDADSKEIPEEGQDDVPVHRSNGGPGSWGLDRIDQQSTNLDNTYVTPANGGEGVHVYVTDTGIRVSHRDFTTGGVNRADKAFENLGRRKVCSGGNQDCANDVQGHGTHCAGTVGGNSYGVAKAVSLHAVKILSDEGTGSFSWFVDALDWILSDGQRPAIISASMGGTPTSNFVKQAVDKVVNGGVSVVVAAGNDDHDACRNQPAFVPSALTVGSTDSRDKRAWDSNFGSCLDIFAPGVQIRSASVRNDNNAAIMSGTSMACPHVAGAAALLLQSNPSLKPAQITKMLKDTALKDKVIDKQPNSPNLLLHVPAADPTPRPNPTPRPKPPPTGVTMQLKKKKKCKGDPPRGWGDLGKKVGGGKCKKLCQQTTSCMFVVFKSKQCTSFDTCELETARGFKTFVKDGGDTTQPSPEPSPQPSPMPSPDGQPTMVHYPVLVGHRCEGQPVGDKWNNLGTGTIDRCKEKCLKSKSCNFALYKQGSKPGNGKCSSFGTCDETETTNGVFEVWMKTGR